MKKLVVACLLIMLSLGNCIHVYALGEDSGWARIVKDNVYLYAEEDSSKQLFMLEKSYYVRVLDKNDKMVYVSVMENETNFPRIKGYVKRTDVEFCSEAPLTPYYPTVRLTVTANSVHLKFSASTSAKDVVTALNTQKVSYYGKINNDRNWYYVCFDGEFGYIDVNSVTAPDVPLHPTPLVKPDSTPTTTTPTDDYTPATSDKSTPTSEILLIVFIVLLAVGLTLALFLPGNIKRKNIFEQDI